MRNGRMSQMDHFAELLSEHVIPEHATPADPAHKGGNVKQCAAKVGRDSFYGNAMLQRIRKALGPQAV